jgi:hypothetical protein
MAASSSPTFHGTEDATDRLGGPTPVFELRGADAATRGRGHGDRQVPALRTANPVGSVVAHVSQHVAAVDHAYESRIFNPPVTKS